MYKSKFVMLLVGLLVTSVAFFGFGDTSQVGDDFFDSEWELDIGDHVGSFESTFLRDFGSNQWSASLSGFSEQAGDSQFDGTHYGMYGVWGSILETDPSLVQGTGQGMEGIERFVYLNMGSNAKSSLSQTIMMGPEVDQRDAMFGDNGDPAFAGFDENYKIYLSTNVAGDKGVYSRYDAGVLFEDSTDDIDATSRWYAGIASPRAFEDQVSSPNLQLLAEGPNSVVSFDLLVVKDNGTHGYIPVADYSAVGKSTLGAQIFSGTIGQPDDREVLAGGYLNADGKAVVGKIETDEGVYEGIVRQFIGSGTGTFTVSGSGRSDLHALIYVPGSTTPSGLPSGQLNPGNLPGADYEYSKFQITAGYSVGDLDDNNIVWSFEGGGEE
jgi:hypothetical protein